MAETQKDFADRGDDYYNDLYKRHLHFRKLGREDPDLAAVLHYGQIDFHDAPSVRQLTKTLLQLDFGLSVDLPDDRLCPPVPSRHGYILWLKELLDSSRAADEVDSDVLGLDIGTGASCIYPLLGCAQRPRWRFVATDIDDHSLDCARANVARNESRLQGRVRVLARTPQDPLVPVLEDTPPFAFTMTNPPFYTSADDMATSAAGKDRPPNAVCTGAPVEMVTPGGEVAFVSRLLEESAAAAANTTPPPRTWYTAMLGKLSSLSTIVTALRARGIDNYAVAALMVPGHGKTRRWAVGWSFGGMRPSAAAARGEGLSNGSADTGGNSSSVESFRHLLPHSPETDVWSAPRSAVLTTPLSVTLDALMRTLELVSWSWDPQSLNGVGRARENVWGRAWRRKKLREQQQVQQAASEMVTEETVAEMAAEMAETTAVEEPPPGECAFGFALSVHMGVKETTVHCRWTEGHSEVIFQSFCGFLKTKLKESNQTGETES